MNKVDLSELIRRHPGATVSKPVDVNELIRRADTLHAVNHAPLPLVGESFIAAAKRSIPSDPYASETERQFAAWLERQPKLGGGWLDQDRGAGERWGYCGNDGAYSFAVSRSRVYTPDFVWMQVENKWKFERVFVEVKWRDRGSLSKTAAAVSRFKLELAAERNPNLDFYFVRPKGKSFVEWAWSYAEVQPDGSVSFRRNVSPWTPRPLKGIRKKGSR